MKLRQPSFWKGANSSEAISKDDGYSLAEKAVKKLKKDLVCPNTLDITSVEFYSNSPRYASVYFHFSASSMSGKKSYGTYYYHVSADGTSTSPYITDPSASGELLLYCLDINKINY